MLFFIYFVGKAVRDEVRGILSPLPFGSRPLASVVTGPAMIERRPKRKGKLKLAQAKYGSSEKKSTKGRKAVTKFQKKLVVIDYMGSDSEAPRNFTVKESLVLL